MIAYVDCIGGASGDMLLAALMDAVPSDDLLAELPIRLGLKGVTVQLTRVMRHGVGAGHITVSGDPIEDLRDWRGMRDVLLAADLSDTVRLRSHSVLARLAETEAAIHAVDVEDVHFHEVGSADTLVDVVGFVSLVESLGITKIVTSRIPLGRGLIKSRHGTLPLPAPATMALLSGVPVRGVALSRELVTPTGAAILATLSDEFGEIPSMSVERIGYGAGSADFRSHPNLLRVLIGPGSVAGPGGVRDVALIETNLDDISPELVPDAIERCFAAGALDVWTTPIAMKKGRPGIMISALARPEQEAAVARAILEETTSLGVRTVRMDRYELDREVREVEVAGHNLRLKLGLLDGRVVTVAPEHEDCAAVAAATGESVKAIWVRAIAQGRGMF